MFFCQLVYFTKLVKISPSSHSCHFCLDFVQGDRQRFRLKVQSSEVQGSARPLAGKTASLIE